jgi:hypothetical protein
VDCAYTHIWVPDYSIRETETTTAGIIESFTGTDPGIGNTLRGNYDAEADVLSLGLRWGLGRR